MSDVVSWLCLGGKFMESTVGNILFVTAGLGASPEEVV